MTKHPLSELTFYAVQNSDGKWFRRKGYGGYGETWTDKPAKARIYTKIGQARSIVTFFANNYHGYPTPVIVVMNLGKIEILDEEERVAKAKEKKAKEQANRESRQAKAKLEAAQQRLAAAQKEIERLKGKK